MINERLDLLREALPYIQRFKNKTFVVKLSGKVTEDQEQLNSLAEEVTLLQQVGIHVAVVHGGGKQLTTVAERLGIEQRIVNGRRVTDDVFDVELTAVAFQSCTGIDEGFGPGIVDDKGNVVCKGPLLGDGVDRSGLNFTESFPFLPTPLSGN